MKEFLDQKYYHYATHFDVAADPISIPKRFSKLQDIEISGLLAATLAWGNRKAILNSLNELLALMDNDPHHFVLHHSDHELKRISNFYYRTFNGTDILYFLSFLKHHYTYNNSLETAFFPELEVTADVGNALQNFYNNFVSLPYFPDRTKKHIGNVAKGSACKRLNMFLRWMVRNDAIDFGLWHNCSPSQLVCPVDVHSGTVARKLGLLSRTQNDWRAAMELTQHLKSFDPNDPIKYDLVLFSLGVEKKL